MDEKSKQATRLWTLALPKVSAFVTSVVRDFKDRDDVIQDIAVAVIESFDAYDTDRPFDAWALGVARNQIGTYLKKRQRHRSVFDTATLQHIETAFSTLPKRESGVLDNLRDCIGQLDGRNKELCKLRYDQNFRPAKIASLMEMTGDSVRKALQRIRSQLRQCVDAKAAAEAT